VEDPGVVLICGRFEGLDQRLIDARKLEEISLGDYVLSGGEIASLAVLDTCVRLLPGVLGSKEGLEEESFTKGLLEYPLYTQPREWEGKTVPEVLLSGHHGDIKTWQQQQAEMVTQDRRPDLWARYREKS
jgi:tRNA (guanine37-N1)-methyltransferase